MAEPLLQNENKNEITRITSEHDYIQFGTERYLRSDLVQAFGGTLTAGLSPPPKFDIGNPGPLGLCAFAMTTFVLSAVNTGAGGLHIPNVVTGLAFFYGGAAQLVAGLFEIAIGNTFGATALCSYGGFWLSYAAILTPSFNVFQGYADHKDQIANSIGIFLIAWFIFTFVMWLFTLKSTVAFSSIFGFLWMTFLLLAIGEFRENKHVTTAGGVFGFITAFIAWYNAWAGMATPQNSYLPVVVMPLPDLQDKYRV